MQRLHYLQVIQLSGLSGLPYSPQVDDHAVRDLGTEGAEDADVSLRKCISHPSIIPGPRYLCASRAIVATGSYGPKNQSRPYVTEVDGKQGADSASGE